MSYQVHSFTIYEEYYDLISLLSDKEQGELLVALNKYMFEGIEPILNDKQMKIFNNLKRPLNKSKNKSKSRTKQNQNEIKLKSNENQNEIKTKTHQDVIVSNYYENNNYVVNVDVNVIIKFIESNFDRTISPYEFEFINDSVKKFGNEIVLYAYQKTLDAGKKSLNYTKGILKNWEQDGFKTIEEIKNSEVKVEKKEASIPNWLDKDIKSEELTEEEKTELDELLSEYKEGK